MNADPGLGRLFQHPDVKPRTRILLMGLGGAGSNAVSNMSKFWAEGPPVIALNTDAQHLAGCDAPRVLQIGENTTHLMGCSGDMNLGRQAMQESIESIKDQLQDVDILFLAVGLGGGTGGGGAPVLLQAAHKMHIMTLVFVTMPFSYESDTRKIQAEHALKNISQIADAVVVLQNDDLIELVDSQAGIQEAFRKSDEQVAATIHALWHLLSYRGILNIDFTDLRSLVQKSGGICHFGYGEGKGASRVPSAVRALLESPYLAKGRAISEAPAFMINITAGPELTMAEIQGIMAKIKSSSRPDADLFFGAIIDPALRGRIALTAIAADTVSARKSKTNEVVSEDDAGMEMAGVTRTKEPQQDLLAFAPTPKNAFEGSESTRFRGQDIDMPTYLRRGIKLSFE
ncbi:MAG TPA: cell division protein FtsZ [Kiritimatiellia bacterium]|nr:cell division protein FtsZ [Kiritimatiellia bacterium]